MKSQILAGIILAMLILLTSLLVRTTMSDFPDCPAEEYTPWADLDDDGDIDLYDAVYMLSRYGSEGCATKSLNITNWPEWWSCPKEMNITNWPLDEYGNLKVSLDGNQSGIYKDVAEITLLDWSSVLTGTGAMDVGVRIMNDVLRCLLPFHFFPKGQLINVTDFWIVFTHATTPSETVEFDITVNSNSTWTSHHYGAFGDFWTLAVTTEHVENVNVYKLIHPGINTLEFRNVQGTYHSVWFYRISVFIEYEYRA